MQERFLYRLERSRYGGEFALKGAILFIWQGEPHRVTRDLDIVKAADMVDLKAR